MLELLYQLNDNIWTILFRMPFHSLAFVLTSISAVCGFVIGFLRWKYKKLPTLPIIELLISFSAYYGIRRIPMIHRRMHTALTTTAGIILQSDTYLKSFHFAYDTTASDPLSVAQVLYDLPRNAATPNPAYLYQQFLKTLDQIKGLGPLGMITDSNPVSFLLITGIITGALQLWFLSRRKTCTFNLVLWFIFFLISNLCLAKLNKGTLFVWLILWIAEVWTCKFMNYVKQIE